VASDFQILIPDIQGFLDDVVAAGGNAQALADAALTNSVREIQREARALAPHQTGSLQRSILTETTWPEASVTVEEKYGIYVEEGTGLYGPNHSRIYPKTARALHWGNVFARSTKGMKAQPFFEPAIVSSTPYVEAQFDQVVDRLLTELAGHSA
jgi:HK97 gp10 family phage protein